MMVIDDGEQLARALHAASVEIGIQHGLRGIAIAFDHLPPRQQQLLIESAALALRRIGMAAEHGRQSPGRPRKANGAQGR